MLYLYRFELLAFDGAANQAAFIGGLEETRSPASRHLHLLTNYERAVTLQADPGPSAFLPKFSTAGQAWTFEPAAIEHEGVRLDGEKTSGQMSVSVPNEHVIARTFAVDPAGFQLWLTVLELASPGGIPRQIFVGQASVPDYDESRCRFPFQTLEMVLARQGLTRQHARSCPHSLFDATTCKVPTYKTVVYVGPDGVNRTYWKNVEDGFLGVIAADGMSITVPEAANRAAGFFDSGFVVVGGHYAGSGHLTRALVESGGASAGAVLPLLDGGLRRSIISHSGETLHLQVPLPVGDYTSIEARTVSIFAGCDGERTTCKAKFSNSLRFGGYPFIPIKNPNTSGLYSSQDANSSPPAVVFPGFLQG